MSPQNNKNEPSLSKIMKSGKSMILAYDQGIEHGPTDFNLKNLDPEFILQIALNADYNAVVLQPGVAEKYYSGIYKKVPLLLKLNGKTKLGNKIISKQLCSVKEAIELGASAVGYTIYPGSEYEAEMFSEFRNIVVEAHAKKIPVIAWVYPRGPRIDENSTENMAYATRVGLELGADIIKIKYNGDFDGFRWAVKCAGKTKVLVAGGSRNNDYDFLKMVEEIMKAGASGIAVGRNVWQNEKPIAMSKAISSMIFNDKTADEAYKIFLKEKT